MKIYIAGPMSAYQHDKENPWNRNAFAAAAQVLRAQGHVVVSPHEMNWVLDGFDGTGPHPNPDHRKYVSRDIPIVTECDGIFFLPGWSESAGSLAEYAAAKACKLVMMYAVGTEKGPVTI